MINLMELFYNIFSTQVLTFKHEFCYMLLLDCSPENFTSGMRSSLAVIEKCAPYPSCQTIARVFMQTESSERVGIRVDKLKNRDLPESIVANLKFGSYYALF